MDKRIIILLLLILATPVWADAILPSGPKDQATVMITDKFSFTVDSEEEIATCSLLVDGEHIKTVTYNDVLRGRILSFSMVDDEGSHSWHIECETTNGETIKSRSQAFTLKSNEGVVKVTASGAFRGSLNHEFTFKNTANQAPVTVPKVAVGDYVTVNFFLDPNTITKELYVKQKVVRNDVSILILEDWKTDAVYELPLGEDVMITMTGGRIIANYNAIANNKATIVFSSPKRQEVINEEEPEPEQPVEKPREPAREEVPPALPPQASEQSGMKRFLGWLVKIFA